MNVALALAKNYAVLAKATKGINIVYLQLKPEAINVLKIVSTGYLQEIKVH